MVFNKSLSFEISLMHGWLWIFLPSSVKELHKLWTCFFRILLHLSYLKVLMYFLINFVPYLTQSCTSYCFLGHILSAAYSHEHAEQLSAEHYQHQTFRNLIDSDMAGNSCHYITNFSLCRSKIFVINLIHSKQS